MLNALFQYQFLQNAVVASVLASIVCGMIGVIIVEKKLLMMSGGIAHTAYGGVGLGYLLGFEPILGAMGFSIAAAFSIGLVKRKGGGDTDVVIAMLWALGMALGIAFIGIAPGYPPNMDSYLFGNILSVTRADLKTMLIMTLIIAAVIIIFYNDWKAYLFDEEFSRILGLKTVFLEYLLLIMVALTVVVMIRVAGIILVIALLSAPAAIARMLTNKLNRRMIFAILLGVFFCLSGLTVSYIWDIASGATIIIISVLSYCLAALIKKACAKRPRSN